jgi:predicted membrane metal-binding protein
VFAAVFAIVGLWPLWDGGPARWWSMGAAGALAAIALLRPATLAPFSRLWTRFGVLLHAAVSPLVLGLLFYLTVAPTGLLMRLFGKDPLRLKRDPEAATYWIARTPPGPAPESLRNQF